MDFKIFLLVFAALATLASAVTTDCSSAMSSAGTYTLDADVSAGTTCTISASSVVFDCDGHTITGGAGSTAVSITGGASNIMIRDCHFFDFGTAVYPTDASGSSNLTVYNSSFDANGEANAGAIAFGWSSVLGGSVYNVSYNNFSNFGSGAWIMSFWGANKSTVIGNIIDAASDSYAIDLLDAANGTIRSNTVSNAGHSIYLQSSPFSTVSSNTISNSIFPIIADATGSWQPENTTISSNVITDCVGTGGGGRGRGIDYAIYVDTDSQNIRVLSNNISNCWNGIYMNGPDEVATYFNISYNNLYLSVSPNVASIFGIKISSSTYNTIAYNFVTPYEPRYSVTNKLEGIQLDYADNNTIFMNTLNNTDRGVYVSVSNGANITYNNITGANALASSTFGVFVEWANDCTASHNILHDVDDWGLRVEGAINFACDYNSVYDMVGNLPYSIAINGIAGVASASYNTVINSGTPTYYGLQLAAVDGIIATGNYISGAEYGVMIEENATFTNSEINGTNYSIFLQGGVSGGNISSNTMTGTQYGVYIDSNVEGTVISGNSVSADNYGVYFKDASAINISVTENAVTGSADPVFSQSAIDFAYGDATNNIAFDNPVVVNASTIGKITVATGVAAINASALPTLNTSARITMAFNGVCGSPVGEPTIYYAPNYYTTLSDIVTHGQVCDEGTTPACTNIVCTGSTISFDVEHFDSYGGEGYPVPEFSGLAALAAILLAAGGYAFARKRR